MGSQSLRLRLFYLFLILGAVIYVEGQNSEEDEDNEIASQSAFDKVEARWKRDVLKGKNGHDVDLVRSKRYIGRVPIAYMKKASASLPFDEPYELDGARQSPSVSHFREFQMRQGANRPNNPSHRNQRRYEEQEQGQGDLDLPALTDEEIQTLLLMLDGYELNGKGNAAASDRLSQMYALGERETGKRSRHNYEQPMSFGNSLYPGMRGGGGGDRLEFLTEGRSKRTGARHLMINPPNYRVKKETDPKVLATLDKAFKAKATAADSESDHSHSHSATLPEDSIKEKPKKSIDWSNYFGLDKRTAEKPPVALAAHEHSAPVVQSVKSAQIQETNAPALSKALKTKATSTATAAAGKEASKKVEERKENETTNKEDDRPDRDWLLHEFYKNFAMSTNIKRKRESPGPGPALNPQSQSDVAKLEELEQKMMQAGDKIIWDAVKYTGAHRDVDMSPSELAQVKNHVIEKLSTAYSLEKVRQAVDELRQEITALEYSQKIAIASHN